MPADDAVTPLPHSFPVMLDLRGVDVLVVGGGRIAGRKTAALLDAGADVTAVAPEFDDAFPAAATRVARPYEPADVNGRRLVVTATGDRTVDAAVSADAQAGGIWVNSADDPANCTFILPAVVRRGPLTVAIGTGGTSPALASWLRARIGDHLDELLGDDPATVLAWLAERRAELKRSGVSTESIDWAPIIDAVLPRHS